MLQKLNFNLKENAFEVFEKNISFILSIYY